jgi:chemotaxis signal transduction protein
VPLAQLREVLPALPRPVPLPFSPPWLLGVFPLRLDVLGLVDPAPLLLASQSPQLHVDNAATALVAGDDVLLALAVSSVGDIALVQPDEIRDDTAGAGPRVDSRYAQGVCCPASGGSYALINMPRLVGDLVRALMEDAAHE